MQMTREMQHELEKIELSPYIRLSTMMICKPRKMSGNMFRHQGSTMLVLIDYGFIDSILIKAALIHDHLEDLEGFDSQLIIDCDADGKDVLNLVLEVTRLPTESKIDFLKRIYTEGSDRACLLKAADRITNLCDCQFLMEKDFLYRLCEESEKFVIPIAERVCKEMVTEITDLIANARKLLSAL